MVLEGLTVPSKAVGVLSREHPYAVQVFFPPHLNVVVVKLPGDMRSAVSLIQSAGEGNSVGVDVDATKRYHQKIKADAKSRMLRNRCKQFQGTSDIRPLVSDLWFRTGCDRESCRLDTRVSGWGEGVPSPALFCG